MLTTTSMQNVFWFWIFMRPLFPPSTFHCDIASLLLHLEESVEVHSRFTMQLFITADKGIQKLKHTAIFVVRWRWMLLISSHADGGYFASAWGKYDLSNKHKSERPSAFNLYELGHFIAPSSYAVACSLASIPSTHVSVMNAASWVRKNAKCLADWYRMNWWRTFPVKRDQSTTYLLQASFWLVERCCRRGQGASGACKPY